MEGTRMGFYDEAAKSTAANYEALDTRPIVTPILEYLPAGGRLLDLGCGSGRDAAFFLKQGYDVTGLDGSEAMLREASTYHPELLGRLIHHALPESLPFNAGAFDILVSFAVIMHLEEALLPKSFSEIARVLRPGGVAAYSVNTARPRLDEHGNDLRGRHFTCLDASTWERYHRGAGLQTVAGWENEDIIGRPGISWITFVCRKT